VLGTVGTAAIRGATAAPQSATDGAIRVEEQATGAEIWQVTTEQFEHTSIYCEVSYCSKDSRYFVYQRTNPKLRGDNTTEFLVVELGTWKQHRLDVAVGVEGCAMSLGGVFYYLKQDGLKRRRLMRADLSEGVPQEVYCLEGEQPRWGLGTVSRDGRYYAHGLFPLDAQWTMFGICLIDLDTGEATVIDTCTTFALLAVATGVAATMW